MIRLLILAVMLALVLGACDADRSGVLRDCINHCSGPDCVRACGEAVHNAFGDK